MPAKGFSYKRDNIINIPFYKKFIKANPEYKDRLDYKKFREVIIDSNKVIADLIINDETGYKLPYMLGYFAVTRYKSKTKMPDWHSTNKHKKLIYHLNLHSFGFAMHIKWFKAGIANFKYNYIYKFKACRSIRRAVSKKTKEGKLYLEWNISDFWNSSRLEKIYNKRYKKVN